MWVSWPWTDFLKITSGLANMLYTQAAVVQVAGIRFSNNYLKMMSYVSASALLFIGGRSKCKVLFTHNKVF